MILDGYEFLCYDLQDTILYLLNQRNLKWLSLSLSIYLSFVCVYIYIFELDLIVIVLHRYGHMKRVMNTVLFKGFLEWCVFFFLVILR